METFPIHDSDSAVPEAASLLEGVEGQLGFLPNVFGVLAGSAPAVGAFVDLNQHFGATSLSDVERETVQIAASVERGSSYCVAGHSCFAHDQQVDGAVVDSLRSLDPLADARLEALAAFTRALIRSDGRVTREEIERFRAAGYRPEQALDVILGICVKTLSNLASNATGIPLDDAFQPWAWKGLA